MQPLSLEELAGEVDAFDAAVRASGEHGHFCSSADWAIPAAEALMPRRDPWLYRGGHGYAAFMRGIHPRGFRYAEPLEAYWGLACPLVGADTAGLARGLGDLLRRRAREWDVLVLSGLVEESPLCARLRRELAPRWRLAVGGRVSRFVASLEGGLDGFLARRSPGTRRALRKARRAAERAGVTIAAVPAQIGRAAAAAAFARLLAVERRSWKGRAGLGIVEPPMADFYRRMVERLAARGRLRLLFARAGDRDVGYILGAVFAGRYRGLQFSFDDDLRRASTGNAMQLAEIERLAEEGVLEYDLGATGGHYKTRWADREVRSLALLVLAG